MAARDKPMTILSTVIQAARTYLKTDSNGLLDADAIVLANEALLSATADLILRGINAAQVIAASANASDMVGIYSWPDGVSSLWTPVSGSSPTAAMWMLKTLNVNYEDTTDNNYKEATLIDVGNLPDGQSYMWLRNNSNTQNPQFDNRGATFEIFPAPKNSMDGQNLTNFFYMMYFAAPTQFVSDSSVVAYPFNLNQNLLASRMAWMESARGNEEAQQRAPGYEKVYLAELDKTEQILHKGNQKSPTPQGLPMTGFEF